MQHTQLTLSDISKILAKSGKTDYKVDIIAHYDPMDFCERKVVKISDNREVIYLKLTESYTGEPVLAEGQDVELNKFKQLFMQNSNNHSAEDQESNGIVDWDLRKLKFVLGEINSWSKDPSTKVSAAIFNGKYPICSSYNGLPPGVEDTAERLNNRDLKYKLVQHAEANAISTCARLGIKTDGMSMAVSLFPCANCAGLIIGAGIKEIITSEPSEDIKKRWGDDFLLSKQIFEEAGVKITMVDIK